jgi:hypothetical protein
MIETALFAARRELYELADAALMKRFAYCRREQIDIAVCGRHLGGFSVVPVVDHGSGRFDFAGADEEPLDAFVMEVFGADAETVVDLVGWRVEAPEKPLAMFGRAGLVGVSAALNPATYSMGGFLRLHRTPLIWLKAGCDGAAVVDEGLAGQQLLQAPGRIGAASWEHGRAVTALMRAAAGLDNKVIAPQPVRRAA